MKNCMFFGTSILKAFWVGFGRVLEGQNHQNVDFLRLFFEVNFEVRFGRRKIEQKAQRKTSFSTFGGVVSGGREDPGKRY